MFTYLTASKGDIHKISLPFILILSLLFFSNSNPIFSQTILTADETFHRVDANGSYKDFLIPSDLSGTYKISFRLLGGDGGGAKTPGYECEAYGGDGAFVTFSFNIGTGANDLAPGGTLRFIPGLGGRVLTGILSSSGSGGGGSGLLYTTASSPSGNTASTNMDDASSKWVILGVAGGGGGAYRTEFGACFGAAHGQGGRASTNGGDDNGGTNGNGGSDSNYGLGGAGVFGAGSSNSSGEYVAKGGISGSRAYSDTNEGFGFGGGGQGGESGGGGGGYSGGGGGSFTENGGGGGSFTNSKALETTKTDGGATEHDADAGYIEYQITQEGAPVALCNDFLAVNLSVYDTEIAITTDDIDNGSYDLGAGTISLSIDNSDCTTLGLGSNLVTLTVTDNDGNISTCQTHVIVLDQAISATEITESVSYTTQSYTGSYKDFKIPYAANFDELCFTLNGGDGGYASVGTLSICPDCKSRGGFGARTQVCFDIGCDDGDLEPGSILRFIIGGKGNSINATEVACNGYGSGGGGGGTGLLYKEYGCNEWEVLAAAGGGGGAFQGQTSGFCTNSNAGGDGQTNANGDASGGSGGSDAGDGGTDGRGGWFGADAGAGGGYDSQGGEFSCGFDGSIGAGQRGYITGGAGGYNEGTGCTGRNGGFGFGGGGMAWDVGGGGGGYSGGGAGGSAGGGGGGGSYVNSDYATFSNITTEAYTGDPADGYIQYRLFGGNSYGSGTVSASCKNTYTVELGEDGTAVLFPNELDNGSSLECDGNGLYAQFIPNASFLDLNCNDVGSQTMTVGFYPQASDASSSSCSTVVTITENEAPTAVCKDITVVLGNNGTVSISGMDVDDGSTDNCGIQSRSLDISDFDCEDVGNHLVILTVTDAAGNQSTCAANVMVEEPTGTIVCCDAPEAVCTDFTVTLDNNGTVSISASNIDNGSSAECNVASRTLDITQFDCDDIGDNTVNLTIYDDKGNADGCSATVTVNDHNFTNAECQNITIQLDASGAVSISTADIDNSSTLGCDGTPTLSLDITNFNCDNVGDNTVTLSASSSGGSASCTAIVTVEDDTPPVANCQDISVMLGSDGTYTMADNEIDDNSSDACGIATFSLSKNSFDCDDIGTHSITQTVTDENGLSSSCTATVTINDDNTLYPQCQDITIQLDANGTASITVEDIDNGSLEGCVGTPSMSLDIYDFDCDDVGNNTVTLTTNGSAGTASCTATVTVEDVIAPTANCQDISILLESDGTYTMAANEIDNSSSDVCGIASLVSSQTSFDCSNIGLNTVTLTVTDANTNVSTCSANVTVGDNVAPTALCQDVTIQLDASGNGSTTAQAVNNNSNDACGIASLALSQTSFDCSDVGSNTVSLTVTDVNANVATCSANVTVVDNVASTAICQDVTIQLDANGNGSTTPQAIDNSSNDACGVASLALSQTNFDCSHVGSNTITLTVTDVNANVATCTAIVTVEDNIAPIAICQDVTANVPNNGKATITPQMVDNGSSDACGFASQTLDQTIFHCNDIGVHTVTLTVTDPSGNISSCTSSVTVEDNTIPKAICEDVTIQLDANGNASVSAQTIGDDSYDVCDDYPTLMLSQSTFDCSEVGPNTVILSVTDFSNNVATCTATVTVIDHNTLFPECQDITIQLDANGNASINAEDIDHGSLEGCIGAPAMSLDIYDFDCNDVGNKTVTLSISGDIGTASCTATVTVEDVTAPQAICQDISIYLLPDGTYTMNNDEMDLNSSDACGIVSYSLSKNTFDCSEVGSLPITQTVTDANGLSSSCTATVTIIDQVAPDAQCKDITIYLNSEGAASISTSDINNGSSDACGIASVSLDKQAFSCNEVGSNTVTLTVVDINNNSNSCNAIVTIMDNLPPTPLCQNINIQLDDSGHATLSAPDINNESFDNCGIATLALNQTDFDCSHLGDNTVTLTITDVNNNSSSCEASVTVEDDIPPIAQCQDVIIYLNDAGNAYTSPESINLNSTDNCSISSLSLSNTTFTCDGLGGNAVTLTLTDIVGNTSTCTATVTVLDKIAPTAYCLDTEVIIQPDGTYTLTQIDVYNSISSYDNCAITNVSFPATTYNCYDIGSINPIDVTVQDQSGNISICRSYISVAPGNGLPNAWTGYDIGTSATQNNYAFDPCHYPNPDEGTFYISSSGQNATTHNSDALAFVGQSLCGDGSITAKIESVSPNGYGGLMIRETADDDSKQVAIFSNLSNSLRHETRYITGANKVVQAFFKPSPYWLKLERQGDWIFAYYSTTGSSFQYVHSVYVPMQGCVELGMATFSYLPGVATEAVFSHVTVSSSNGGFSTEGNHLEAISSKASPNLSVYPNPNTGQFTVQLGQVYPKKIQLEIYNLYGQSIAQKIVQAHSSSIKWDLGNVPTGTYFIRMNNVKGKQMLKQFIISY